MEESSPADEHEEQFEHTKYDSDMNVVTESEPQDVSAVAEQGTPAEALTEANGSKHGSTSTSTAGAAPEKSLIAAANQSPDGPAAATDSVEGPAAEEPAAPETEESKHSSSSRSSSGSSSSNNSSSNSSSSEKPQPAKEPDQLSRKSDSGKAAAAAAAAAPKAAAAGALQNNEHKKQLAKGSSTARKETAAERLTTPTAMRMLKTLEQTQGGKSEWHIATGVPFMSKKLAPDEMTAMVDRLCTPKHAEDNMPAKPHAVKLVFEGTKEVLVPVKETSKADNIAYMSQLYERCQETRAKTMQTLQEKWLQPLIKPKASK